MAYTSIDLKILFLGKILSFESSRPIIIKTLNHSSRGKVNVVKLTYCILVVFSKQTLNMTMVPPYQVPTITSLFYDRNIIL